MGPVIIPTFEKFVCAITISLYLRYFHPLPPGKEGRFIITVTDELVVKEIFVVTVCGKMKRTFYGFIINEATSLTTSLMINSE